MSDQLTLKMADKYDKSKQLSQSSACLTMNTSLGPSFILPVTPDIIGAPDASVLPPGPSPPLVQVYPLQSVSSMSSSPATSPSPTSSDRSSSFSNYQGEQKLYVPVQPHWFFSKIVENRAVWFPMSLRDTMQLEEAYKAAHLSPGPIIVQTDGGRYDCNIVERTRASVYWDESPTEIKRCTWFYKAEGDNRYIPYEEDFAEKLEEEYKNALLTNIWHKRLEFPGQETIVMHNANVIVHFQPSSLPDEWGTSQGEQMRPRIVRRGVDDFDNIEDGESISINHVMFIVHGIGQICDIRFRSLVECVDDFRSNANSLLHAHFKPHVENHKIGRIEFLPVHWHQPLHGDATGLDRKLKQITLKSIPKLREFTNDTLLDILFYTSPNYCQTIVDTVGNEINRLYHLFLSRNPDFNGGVSVAGHSLGSIILFDILAHQRDNEKMFANFPMPSVHSQSLQTELLEDREVNFTESQWQPKTDFVAADHVSSNNTQRTDLPRQTSNASFNYLLGDVGTGQPSVKYPKLDFEPVNFFALGSPISLFLTTRGIESVGDDFKFPTCNGFFNIFHPFDPVAYRIEPLINQDFCDIKPLLIPHHKGRKRLHLELKDSLTKVGFDLKNKIMGTIKGTWNTINDLARAHRSTPQNIDEEVDQVVTEMAEVDTNSLTESVTTEEELMIGQINGGRRIDYVLQEKPIESFNDYLFALASHGCYWESEDTALLILKETYALVGLFPEKQGPQTDASPQTFLNPMGASSSSVMMPPPGLPGSCPSGQLAESRPPDPQKSFPYGPPTLVSNIGVNRPPMRSTPPLPSTLSSPRHDAQMGNPGHSSVF